MRLRAAIAALVAVFCLPLFAFAGNTEDELVQKYLQRSEKKQIRKVGWVSINYSMNRINRNNPYNQFVNQQNDFFSGAEFNWLDQAHSIGIDVGLMFKERFAWSVRGEYWLEQSESLSGTYLYTPLNTASTNVTDPSSEIQVWGVSTALQYYLMNPPTPNQNLENLAVRFGGSVGYYTANWDLWPTAENLNLATTAPAGQNTTFKGTGPGFSFSAGVDYPLGFWGMGLGVDFGYLYLNFTNVAWYNSLDQEVVLSVDGTEEGRVDLDLSGFVGKVEFKRFFSF